MKKALLALTVLLAIGFFATNAFSRGHWAGGGGGFGHNGNHGHGNCGNYGYSQMHNGPQN
jgi:Spy/CpxP family protein refolding chaperone